MKPPPGFRAEKWCRKGRLMRKGRKTKQKRRRKGGGGGNKKGSQRVSM
jgi:hypothetical protein